MMGEYKDVAAYKHQKFVSDFISENTPYRGLLLYHGLGSGKSGASIMISEGLTKKTCSNNASRFIKR